MQTTVTTPQRRRLEDLAGPRGWPVLGNLPQMMRRPFHQSIEQWSRHFGTLFRVSFGVAPVLVVAERGLIVSILRERPDAFRRVSRLREIADEMGAAPGLFTAEGKAWRRQRSLVMSSFSPHHVRAYFPTLIKVVQRLRARWEATLLDASPIDLQADLKRFAVDAIGGLALGTDIRSLESGDDPIHEHLDVILAGTARRTVCPFAYWRWIKRPADRKLERSVAALKRLVEIFMMQARARLGATPDQGGPGSLLEAMLAAGERGTAAVDDTDIAGNVATMLFAGEDTTANTLAWCIYLLARTPGVLRRAQDEVRSRAPDLGALVAEDMDKLEFVGACVDEAMRLKPVAPFLVVEAIEDTTIGDVRVMTTASCPW